MLVEQEQPPNSLFLSAESVTNKIDSVCSPTLGIEQMTTMRELPITKWCEDNNIIAYSAWTKPYFCSKKNRISKGSMENKGFGTMPMKHLTGFDLSAISDDHTMLMARCGNDAGHLKRLIIDVDVRGEQTAKDVVGAELFEYLESTCGCVVETGSGGRHYYYTIPEGMNWKSHTNLAMFLGHDTHCQLDIIGNDKGVILPGSFYVFDGKKYSYKYIKGSSLNDATLLPTTIVDEINKDPYCSINKQVIPKQPQIKVENTVVERSTTPIKTSEADLQLLADLLDCLKADWLQHYDNWYRLVFAVKNCSNSSTARDLVVKVCRRSPKHNTEEGASSTLAIWAKAKTDGTLGMGSLRYWAKLNDPDKYFKIFRQNYEHLLIQGGRNGHAKVFANEFAGNLVFDQNNSKEGVFYLWSEHHSLWKAVTVDKIHSLFMDHMPTVVDRVRKQLPQIIDEDEHKNDETKNKKKTLTSLYKTFCDGLAEPTLRVIRAELNPSFSPIIMDTFQLDNNPNLLPLNNGVFNFATGKFEKYDRTHYLTTKFNYNYNPNASSKDLEDCMLKWFCGDKEVIDFVQYWAGMCLTGHQTRDELLINHGPTAGNGKTTFWEEILGEDLLSGKDCPQYYVPLTEDALSKYGENNDSLYNALSARLTIATESGGSGTLKLNESAVKRITGRGQFSVGAKYKNVKTGTFMAKVVMIANEMPKFNPKDNGMRRRILALLWEHKFCRDDEWFALTEAERADIKRFSKRDPGLIARIRANREGTLNWLLKGAMRYMANPTLAPPAKVMAYTMEQIDKKDIHTQWVKETLTLTGDLNDTIRFSLLANYWATAMDVRPTDGIARNRFREQCLEKIPGVKLVGNSTHGWKVHGVRWKPCPGCGQVVQDGGSHSAGCSLDA